MVDVASPNQALAKVRIRINQNVFVDYLVFLKIGGEWRITSKAFYLEKVLHLQPDALYCIDSDLVGGAGRNFANGPRISRGEAPSHVYPKSIIASRWNVAEFRFRPLSGH